MQWVDIDMYSSNPLPINPKQGAAVPGATTGRVPVIRLYGVTEVGNSIMYHIYGFTPYFYCNVPPGFVNDAVVLGNFRTALNKALENSKRGYDKYCE